MLSVCLLSGGDPARLTALLRALRPVADELVVAVDERVDTSRLGPAAALADTMIAYPFAEPVERPFGWLHSLCHGDWIFRIDDDEAPSRSLLGLLSAPPDDLTHVYIPRRWLWAAGALDQSPWKPDWQLRLVRAEAARFPGAMHIPIRASGAHAYLDAPLYHLDLVVNSRERRIEKARRYDLQRPGLRLGGLPLNAAYYLPETRAELRVSAIPAEDAELVEALLRPPQVDGAAELAAATREEVDRHWALHPLADYAARIEPRSVVDFVAGEVRAIDVRVSNRSGEMWPGGTNDYPEVRLSYRWDSTEDEGLRTALPHDLAPGEELLVPVFVRAPLAAGRHVLRIDLVHEGVRWFGTESELTVDVLPRRVAVVLVGQPPGDEAFDARVDEVLARLDSSLEPLLVGPKPSWLRDRFGCPAQTEAPADADEVHVVAAGSRRNRLRLALAARRLRR